MSFAAFEIRTPILKNLAVTLQETMNGVSSGAVDHAPAMVTIKAASDIRRTVETDLKVRLAAPKLAKIEA